MDYDDKNKEIVVGCSYKRYLVLNTDEGCCIVAETFGVVMNETAGGSDYFFLNKGDIQCLSCGTKL